LQAIFFKKKTPNSKKLFLFSSVIYLFFDKNLILMGKKVENRFIVKEKNTYYLE